LPPRSASGAISPTLTSLLNAEGGVLLADPATHAIPQPLVRLLGGKPKAMPVDANTNFQLNADRWAIAAGTDMLGRHDSSPPHKADSHVIDRHAASICPQAARPLRPFDGICGGPSQTAGVLAAGGIIGRHNCLRLVLQ
jgi:hypothetical protein